MNSGGSPRRLAPPRPRSVSRAAYADDQTLVSPRIEKGRTVVRAVRELLTGP